jgi:hypothetical protein
MIPSARERHASFFMPTWFALEDEDFMVAPPFTVRNFLIHDGLQVTYLKNDMDQ